MEKILTFQRLNKYKDINLEMELNLTSKERIKNLIIPQQINTDLAYFCGVLAGDGSIGFRKNKKEYCIKCVGNPKDEQEFYNIIIKKLIKKLFNIDITPKFHDKRTTYGFSLYSKSILKYLTEFISLPLGKKYDKLKIPPIFLSNPKLVKSFISGVFDTDFHLAIRRGYYPVISGVSKSKSFVGDIKNFLEKEGFKVCMYERRDNDIRVGKVVITYRIELSGYKQFKKWIKEIGSRHPKNAAKINLLLKLNNKI